MALPDTSELLCLYHDGVQEYDGGSDFGVTIVMGKYRRNRVGRYKGRKGVERSKFSTQRKAHWCRLTKTL